MNPPNSPTSAWRAAALAGLACSMRSLSGPAVLAARGRAPEALRKGLLLAAGGELVADKLPVTPARIKPGPWAGRIMTGAYTGRAIAGATGALAGALGAGAGTYLTWGTRKRLGERTSLPDPALAVCEDLLAYGLVAICTRGSRLAADA